MDMKSNPNQTQNQTKHQAQYQALYAVTLSAFLLLFIKSQALVLYWQQSRHVLLDVTPPPAWSDFAPAWLARSTEPIWQQSSQWFFHLGQAPWQAETNEQAEANEQSEVDEQTEAKEALTASNDSNANAKTLPVATTQTNRHPSQTQAENLVASDGSSTTTKLQAANQEAMQSLAEHTAAGNMASGNMASTNPPSQSAPIEPLVATNNTVDKQSAAAATSRLINGNPPTDATAVSELKTVAIEQVNVGQSVADKTAVKPSAKTANLDLATPAAKTIEAPPVAESTPDATEATVTTTLATLNSIDAAGQIELMPQDKVLLIGDSLMQGLAPHLIARFNKKHQITTVDMSRHSTGLTYPAFYNWPDAVTQAFAQQNFDVLVVFMGANDPWDMTIQGKYIRFGSERWQEIYRERVRTILSTAKMHQTRVIWLGTPPMGREDLKEKIPQLNQIYQAEVAKFSENARFIDTAPVLTADGKTYSRFLELPERGSVMLRTDDGIHFTTQGHKLLSTLTLAQFRLPATKKKS